MSRIWVCAAGQVGQVSSCCSHSRGSLEGHPGPTNGEGGQASTKVCALDGVPARVP